MVKYVWIYFYAGSHVHVILSNSWYNKKKNQDPSEKDWVREHAQGEIILGKNREKITKRPHFLKSLPHPPQVDSWIFIGEMMWKYVHNENPAS